MSESTNFFAGKVTLPELIKEKDAKIERLKAELKSDWESYTISKDTWVAENERLTAKGARYKQALEVIVRFPFPEDEVRKTAANALDEETAWIETLQPDYVPPESGPTIHLRMDNGHYVECHEGAVGAAPWRKV